MTTETAPFRPIVAGSQPANDTPSYGSTHLRHPTQPPLRIPQTVTETTGPRFSPARFGAMADLSVTDGKQAQGERIIVRGRVVDENDRPIPHTMIEIWQANAAGRYDHPGDQHDAPLDPNFHGGGRVFSDADGWYQFTTIKPGRLSVAQPPQRVAAEPYSLFAVRHRLRAASDHPDVFPGRPAAGAGSRSISRSPTWPRGSVWSPVRHRHHLAGMGVGLSFRFRPARPRRHANRAGLRHAGRDR